MAPDIALWYVMIPAIVTGLGLSFSYYFLFKANFPDTNGGDESLVLFVEIWRLCRLERILDELC